MERANYKFSAIPVIILIIMSFMMIFSFGCEKKEERKEIKIGVVLPLTGSRANAGQDAKEGIELALSDINSSGGINGKTLKLIYEDNQTSSQVTVSAVKKLIEIDQVPVIIGPLSSSATLAAAPIAEKSKVVLFSPTASSPDISNAGDYIFRNGVLAEQQTKKLADFCISTLKCKEIAILYINDETGRGYRDTFKFFFENQGGTNIIAESFEKNETDFKTQITKLKNTKVKFAFVPSTPQSLGLIIKQSVEMGYKPTYLANFGIEGDDLLKFAGEHAEGIYYASIPISEDFKYKLQNSYGKKEASVVSALGYDSVYIIAEAIRNGGYDAEDIKMKLYDLSYNGVTGEISFDKYGDAQKEIIIKTIKNGKFVPLNPQ